MPQQPVTPGGLALFGTPAPRTLHTPGGGTRRLRRPRLRPAPPPQTPASSWRSSSSSSDAELRLDLDGLSCKAVSSQGTPPSGKEFTSDTQQTVCVNTVDTRRNSVCEKNPIASLHSTETVPTHLYCYGRSSPAHNEQDVHHNLLKANCGTSADHKSASPVLNNVYHTTNSQTSLLPAGEGVSCRIPVQGSQSQLQKNTECAVKVRHELDGPIRTKHNPSFQPEKFISLESNPILNSSNLITTPSGHYYNLSKNRTQYLEGIVTDNHLAYPSSDEPGSYAQDKHSETKSNDTCISSAKKVMGSVGVNDEENFKHQENICNLLSFSRQHAENVTLVNESLLAEPSSISENSTSPLPKEVTKENIIVGAPISHQSESLLSTGKEAREKSISQVSSSHKTECCTDNNIFRQPIVLKSENSSSDIHIMAKRDFPSEVQILHKMCRPTSHSFEQCQSTEHATAFANQTLEDKLMHNFTKSFTSEISKLDQGYSAAQKINGDELIDKTNISNLHNSAKSKIDNQTCKSLVSSEEPLPAHLTIESEGTIQQFDDLKLTMSYSEMSGVTSEHSSDILLSQTMKTIRTAPLCLENCEKSNQNCTAINKSENKVTYNLVKTENSFKIVDRNSEGSTQPYNKGADLCEVVSCNTVSSKNENSITFQKFSLCQQQLPETIGGRIIVQRSTSSEHSNTKGTGMNKSVNNRNLYFYPFHFQDGDVSESFKLLFDRCKEIQTTKVFVGCGKSWPEKHITEIECNGGEKSVMLHSSYNFIANDELETIVCDNQKACIEFLFYGNGKKLKLVELESIVNYQNRNCIHLFLLSSCSKTSDEILSCPPESTIKEICFHFITPNENTKPEVTNTICENKKISFEVKNCCMVYKVAAQERSGQMSHCDGIKQRSATSIMYYQLQKSKHRKYFCTSKEIFQYDKHYPINNSWLLIHSSSEEDLRISKMIHFRGDISEFLYRLIATHKFLYSSVDYSDMLFSDLRNSVEINSSAPRKLTVGTEVNKSGPMICVKDGKNKDNLNSGVILFSDIDLLHGSFGIYVKQERIVSEENGSQISADVQEYLQNNLCDDSDICKLFHLIQQRMPPKLLSDAKVLPSTSINLPSGEEESNKKNSEVKTCFSETSQFEEDDMSASMQVEQLFHFNDGKCGCGYMSNTLQQMEVGYKQTKVAYVKPRYQPSDKTADFPHGISTQINCEHCSNHSSMTDMIGYGPDFTFSGSFGREEDLLQNVQESERNVTPESLSSCSIFSYDTEDSEKFVGHYISKDKCDQSSQNSQFFLNDRVSNQINNVNCTLCKNNEEQKLSGLNFECQRVFKCQLTDKVNTMSDGITVSVDEVQQMAYHARHLADTLERLLLNSCSSSQMAKNSSELQELFSQKSSSSSK